MAFQISDQLRSFGLAILLGLAAGVVYDLLRTVRLRFPSFTGVLDLLYVVDFDHACANRNQLKITVREQ